MSCNMNDVQRIYDKAYDVAMTIHETCFNSEFTYFTLGDIENGAFEFEVLWYGDNNMLDTFLVSEEIMRCPLKLIAQIKHNQELVKLEEMSKFK